MKRMLFLSLFGCSLLLSNRGGAQRPGTDDRYNVLKNPSIHYDSRVDNMLYWNYALRKGYLEAFLPSGKLATARFVGSQITSPLFVLQDSPDITLMEGDITQSENSITTHPLDFEKLLNSNNSSDFPVNGLFGADWLRSDDGAESWEGEKYGAGGDNSGDPAVAINSQGRMFIGYINENFGQSVSFSDDNGQNWTKILVAPSPGFYPASLDKNHLWIDNSPESPYNGSIYAAWTRFSAGGSFDGEIQFSRSVNNGTAWSYPTIISSAIAAGSHNQGVNIQTGPNGEVYLVWAVYDIWPADENALGFCVSFDGGLSFQPSMRIINNIRGIRYSETTKNLRVNSFPSMTVDLSNGPRRGTIYVVWANHGVPGVNTGDDIDVYIIKSSDQGLSWSTPIRVNQDLPGMGKQHFFPWISCDPVSGNLAVIFYDDRECSASECETWVAYSTDGGDTWQDFRVSDVAFTPQPIPGLAANYFGDYIGITSHNLKIYPVWTDNRSGKALSYVSPVNSTPAPNQPYVVHQDHVFRNFAGSQVNLLKFSDSLSVDLTALNIGDQPANQVNITLSSPSPYIFVTDSNHYYGDFAPQQSVSVNQAFKFRISDTVPDNERIKFIVRAANPDTFWMSHFYARASAPDLRIKTLLIDDIGGNGNHIPDAGESASIGFILANEGDYVCDTIHGFFSSNKDWVSYSDSTRKIMPLFPGQIDTVFFGVTFSDSLPYGSPMIFRLKCHSGSYIRQKSFLRRSSLRVEDWESGGFTQYPWKRTGNSPWSISSSSYEGIYAARSGVIPDGGSSILSITYDIQEPDSVTFWYRISSESNYDFFSFFVDNILYGKWSGIRDWRKAAYWVPAGRHTLRWQYEKDIFQAMGEDAVWLDYIVLPVFVLPQANAGQDITVCSTQDSVYVEGQAENFTAVKWATLGDGFFKNDASPATWYFPGQIDIATGKATLLFTASNEMASSSDTLTVIIHHPPLPPSFVVAVPDSLCKGEVSEIKLQAQPADSVSIVYWFKNNCSSEPIATGLSATIPAPDETSIYYAQSSNACGYSSCNATVVFVLPSPTLHLGPDSIYCSGETVILDGGDFKNHQWSVGIADRFLVVDTTKIQEGTQQTLYVFVEDSLGCHTSDTITIGFKRCAPGIPSMNQIPFHLYPNPTKGDFILSWNRESCFDFELELIDLQGRILYHRRYSKASSPSHIKIMPRPAPGNYLLIIKDNENQIVFPVNIIEE